MYKVHLFTESICFYSNLSTTTGKTKDRSKNVTRLQICTTLGYTWMSYKNISKKLGENMTTVRAIIQKKLSPLKEFFPHRVRMITKKVDQPRATLVNDVKANKTTVTKNTTFNTLHIETLQRSKFTPWLCSRSYKLRRRTFPPLYIDYCRQRKRLTILK